MAKLSGYRYGTVIRYKNPSYEKQKVHFDNAQEYIDIEKTRDIWKPSVWMIVSDGLGKGLYVNPRFVPEDYEIVKR